MRRIPILHMAMLALLSVATWQHGPLAIAAVIPWVAVTVARGA